MSKLYFNTKGINNIIIPSLEDTINNLNSALNELNSSSIPNECNINLNVSINDIESVKSSLQNIKNWCQDSINIYNRTEDSFINEAMLLPKNLMPLRNTKIKG